VNELGCEQPKTTKELLNIATRHASGEEAVGGVFVQGGGMAVPSGHRGTSVATTDKGRRGASRATRGGQDGGPKELRLPPVVMRR
jgi:hypothetical protein